MALYASLPNVSPFGWTSNDLKNTQQLEVYVSKAIDAANHTDVVAEYVDSAALHVDAIENSLTAQIAVAAQNITDSQALKTDLQNYGTQLKTDVTAIQTNVQTTVNNFTKTSLQGYIDVMNYIEAMYTSLQKQFPQLDPLPTPKPNP